MLFASCGHVLHPEVGALGEGHAVPLRVMRPGDHRAVSYRLVCSECLERYREQGLVLETQQDTLDWLSGRGNTNLPLA